MYKNITISWLFETELTNMNSGEGSSNLKELKTYNNGLPYISGQSMRHALRESLKRTNEENFKCTPEYPCGDIKNCWTCDLFGYLLPSEGSKRWSPIKAAPALGQKRNNITTDLIFRMVEDIACPNCNEKIYPLSARDKDKDKDKDENEDKKPIEKNIKRGNDLKCPKCGKKFKAPYDIRQALAYKQLTNNIYKTSLSIDVENIGVEKIPKIDENTQKLDGIKNISNIEIEDKSIRIKAILEAIYNLNDFANQSREMVNSSPDFVIISLQKNFNHRLASVFKLDEYGKINTEVLKSVIEDILTNKYDKIYVGYIKGIIDNEEEVEQTLNEVNESNKYNNLILCENPRDVFNKVIEEVDKNGSS